MAHPRLSAAVFVSLLAALAVGGGTLVQSGYGRAEDADPGVPVRGQVGDFWADAILGQQDFTEVTGNRVVANRLFNPNGVLVDRSTVPNRVYVYDAGNSRVLGLSHLGTCTEGPDEGLDCTSRSDCPASTCRLDRDLPADIVLGQPGLVDHAACNGDSGFHTHPLSPPASARTLCLLRVDQMSILEGGSAATMALDAAGNLYVPDFFNHRVLRYDRPFETDAVADHVWGQTDFTGHDCNHARGQGSAPDATSLCLAPSNGLGTIEAGVAIDTAGNLWVTDKLNHRVLRYPQGAGSDVPAAAADLVLGQRDFAGHATGTGLDDLNAPGAVRVDGRGVVYIADTYNSRLLAYEPPLRTGMSASTALGSGMNQPSGLEIGPDGDLWVNDSFNRRMLRFRGRTQIQALAYYASGDWGGPGVDRDGDLLQSGWTFQSLLHHVPPPNGDGAITPDLFLLSSARNFRVPNEVDGSRLFVVNGMTVAGDQLVVADADRLVYWNQPWAAISGQVADGVIGQPDMATQALGGYFGRLDPDRTGRLWALHSGATVAAYRLPLASGARPIMTLRPPLPLAGGGSFDWSDSLAIGDVAADPSGDAVWASDRDHNRVFRINHLASQPEVDVVLGQSSSAGKACNRGRGRGSPSQDSLCAPGGLAFDSRGNLFVADHTREFDGNHRLLMWAASSFPDAPVQASFGKPASRVYGRGGSFTEPDCQSPLCAPFDPIFDAQDRMVAAVNPYLNNLDNGRFPLVFDNILHDDRPTTRLRDYFSMSLQGAFDRFGNLYMSDHNRSRVLIYREPFAESGASPTATMPAPATGTRSPTATATATRPPPSTVPPVAAQLYLPAAALDFQ